MYVCTYGHDPFTGSERHVSSIPSASPSLIPRRRSRGVIICGSSAGMMVRNGRGGRSPVGYLWSQSLFSSSVKSLLWVIWMLDILLSRLVGQRFDYRVCSFGSPNLCTRFPAVVNQYYLLAGGIDGDFVAIYIYAYNHARSASVGFSAWFLENDLSRKEVLLVSMCLVVSHSALGQGHDQAGVGSARQGVDTGLVKGAVTQSIMVIQGGLFGGHKRLDRREDGVIWIVC